ncbi:MAG: hypothetical protein HOP17_12110 [Acidobacteria bacterium]|nr:hypothetical protein [Acidobacteriota bacterium]
MFKGFVILAFLVLLFVRPTAFSQAPETGPEIKKEAELADSFGRTTNGMIRSVLDTFMADLYRREKGTRGVIVTYGTVREIEARKRLISNHFLFRNVDKTLVTYVRGGNVSEFRTDLWIVPNGASEPNLPPEAFIVEELGKATKAKFVAMIKRVFREVANNPSYQTYIINYGTNAEIARREKWITREIVFRHYDRSRITLVRGGKKSGPRTVAWLAPPGAANPAP